MLNIDIERTGGVALLKLAGRIVRGTELSSLSSAVIAERGSRVIILDLSDVSLVDAGGLTTLVSLQLWAREEGIQLDAVNPSPFVCDVLERTGLARVFHVSGIRDALYVLSGMDCPHAKYAAA